MSPIAVHARQLGVSLPVQDELEPDDYRAIAAAADAGRAFDWLCLGEIAGPEAFAMLGALAATTARIGLATGIVSLYTRSPALLAMGFATLDALAPGRVMAGLGASSRTVVETWNGRSFTAPARQAVEVATALRGVLAGERGDFEGELVAVRDFRLMPARPHAVPIMLGAIQPGMLRAAGGVADVVYLAFCPVDELAGRIALVREGAAAAGRDPDAVRIALSLNAYAGPETEAARDRMRDFVIRYAALPTHAEGFAAFRAELDAALALERRGERQAARAAVPDSAVERVCAVGDAPHVLARAAACWEAGVDLVVLHALAARRHDAAGPLATVQAIEATHAAAAGGS